jgi:hypothetical protein
LWWVEFVVAWVCDGLIFWEGSASLRFGGTGEAPVATWPG